GRTRPPRPARLIPLPRPQGRAPRHLPLPPPDAPLSRLTHVKEPPTPAQHDATGGGKRVVRRLSPTHVAPAARREPVPGRPSHEGAARTVIRRWREWRLVGGSISRSTRKWRSTPRSWPKAWAWRWASSAA